MDRLARLRQVCSAAGLDPVTAPRQVLSWSNDAWLFEDRRLGAVALRVGWRGDLARLDREMAVAEHLPAAIRYPRVLGHGRTSTGERSLAWSLTRQLDGELLDSAW